MPDGLLVPVPAQSRFPETMVCGTETRTLRKLLNSIRLKAAKVPYWLPSAGSQSRSREMVEWLTL
jgi:hypothetical protein